MIYPSLFFNSIFLNKKTGNPYEHPAYLMKFTLSTNIYDF